MILCCFFVVVLYPKDTEKWKQFTTGIQFRTCKILLFCIPKILKNESNSQRLNLQKQMLFCCFVSQRYWKMKAIHNSATYCKTSVSVVLYPKDTEKWKQFTTDLMQGFKIQSCFVSQRYWKMKAIHNNNSQLQNRSSVVLYPKDTEKWKQFTTWFEYIYLNLVLFCIPKILKNESNSQRNFFVKYYS